MPQDIGFYLPFPVRSNPDADRARGHHLDWIRDFDLVRSQVSLDRYQDWLLTDLAAYAFPDARRDDLDLVTDAVCLGFPLDDQFDGPLGWQPERVARLTDELAAIAYRRPGTPPVLDAPITRAYTDVWLRSARGMSPAWRRRAAYNWARFFRAYVVEARNKSFRIPLEEAAYVQLRREAVGTASCFDLIERAHHFELSPELHDSAGLRTLRECAGDVVFLCNDVHSVEREEARGDPHNLVLIRQRTRGCTRRQALEQVRDMVRDRVELFLTVADRTLGPAAQRRSGACEYDGLTCYVEGLRAWMVGNQRWGVTSARYAARGAALDFVEDVTGALTRDGG